jgi:hypothetical protein
MLTASECKNAQCPPERMLVRIQDVGSLYLEVTPKGSKRWLFYKYMRDNKERRLAIGVFPEATLAQARSEKDKARLLKADAKALS